MTNEEIYTKVAGTLVEALNVDDDEIKPTATLQGDPAECAALLKLSQKTISNHQTMIKEKLGVGTTAALVHLAIRHGVIAPDGSAGELQ